MHTIKLKQEYDPPNLNLAQWNKISHKLFGKITLKKLYYIYKNVCITGCKLNRLWLLTLSGVNSLLVIATKRYE